MSLMVIVALGLITAAYVLSPLLASAQLRPQMSRDQSRLAVLEDEKEVVYENIRDLEFEKEMGKISQEDYEHLRKELTQEAVRILKDIDHTGEDDTVDRIIDLDLERLRRSRSKGEGEE